MGSPPGGSTFNTSAPSSARSWVAYGPGRQIVKSRTRSPSSSPSTSGSVGEGALERRNVARVRLARAWPVDDEVRDARFCVAAGGIGEGVFRLEASLELGPGQNQPADRRRIATDGLACIGETLDLFGDDGRAGNG